MSAPLCTEINGVASATPSVESAATTSAPIEPSWHEVLRVDPAADIIPSPTAAEGCALIDDIKVNGILEPIVLRRNPNGEVSLLDGRTRLNAATLAGLRLVKDGKIDLNLVPYRYVETDDPVGLVLSLNLHRRHLSPKQKHDIIAKILKAKPEVSNNAIAAQVKADDKTVAKVRDELERRSEIPNVATRTDSRGRRQAAHRRPKPNAAATERAPTKANGHNGAAGGARAEPAGAQPARVNGTEKPVEAEPSSVAHVNGADVTTDAVDMRIRFAVMAALDEFFDAATGAEIYARIPAEKRAEVLAAAMPNKAGNEPEQRSTTLARLLERIEIDEFLQIVPPHLRKGLEKYMLGLQGLRRSAQLTASIRKALSTKAGAEQITILAAMNRALAADKMNFGDVHIRVPKTTAPKATK